MAVPGGQEADRGGGEPGLFEILPAAIVDRSTIEAIAGLIDAFLPIPVLETTKKFGEACATLLNVRDRLFMKKVLRFYNEVWFVPQPQRDAFSARMEAEPTFRKRVGEQLALLLERADDMEKPGLIARAFAAHIRDEVSWDQFERMAAGIDRALMPDLRELGRAEDPIANLGSALGRSLLPSGLAEVRAGGGALGGGSRTFYLLTDAGKLIREHCLSPTRG